MKSCGLVLLAAGASARLGCPKQLLAHQGKTLLDHMVEVAKDAVFENMVLVLGADAQSILSKISETQLSVVQNHAWEEGIASSIRQGLSGLLERIPEIDAVIFMLCDQPFVTGSLLKELIKKNEDTQKPIIACRYAETLGTPAFFSKSLFVELQALKGQQGAKKVILRHPDLVASVAFPQGSVDIDTAADFEAFQKMRQGDLPV